MKISKNGKVLSSSKIMAAGEEDIEYMQDDMSGDDAIGGMIDDFQMQNDFQDDTEEVIDDSEEGEEEVEDDVEQDDVDIEIENNIDNHYIAECDSCHGVFISALVETDQDVEMISGTCPLCGKDTDQYLKWIIRAI